MHFLKKIIETPSLDDPAINHMDVHRHFYRYSKGEFIGPALKISRTNTKITLKGSHEYEDLIEELVVRSISDPQKAFEIKGTLITGTDLSDTIKNLGFSWNLKKSSGQTKNYKVSILTKTNPKQLLDAIYTFRQNSYFLISFNINANCKVSTKKTIPQPSKKKVEEDDINQRVQFCTGILSNDDTNVKHILEEALPDFKTEYQKNWKSISITNNYKINNIELPKNIEDSRLLRILAIRKGRLTRNIEFNSQVFEKQYSFLV